VASLVILRQRSSRLCRELPTKGPLQLAGEPYTLLTIPALPAEYRGPSARKNRGPRMTGFCQRIDPEFHFGGLVIAPCDADDTSAEYLANTPVG
jgi:hypothetical protein